MKEGYQQRGNSYWCICTTIYVLSGDYEGRIVTEREYCSYRYNCTTIYVLSGDYEGRIVTERE